MRLHGTKGVVIVGAAGSAAETVACKLLSPSLDCPERNDVTLILDRPPYSPDLQSVNKKLKVYYNDLDKGLVSVKDNKLKLDWKETLDNKVVIGIEDGGDKGIRGEKEIREPKNEAMPLLVQLSKALASASSSIGPIILATNAIDDQPINSPLALFNTRATTSIRAWGSSTNSNIYTLVYNSLVGGVPGQEPAIFTSLPLIEPELHPSYAFPSTSYTYTTTGSNVDGDGISSTTNSICTRNSLANSIIALIVNKDIMLKKDVLVSSTEGPELQLEDYKKLFISLNDAASTNSVVLLNVLLEEVRLKALYTYIIEEWFLTIFSDPTIATILKGPRPTRITSSSTGTNSISISIIYEDIDSNLNTEKVGALVIEISEDTTNNKQYVLKVRRDVAKSSRSLSKLPSESRIVDLLYEALNTVGLKKKLCQILKK
jgi:hypothetical protein